MNIKKIIQWSFAGMLLCFINSVFAVNFVKGIRSNSFDEKLQIVIDLEQNPDFKVFALSNPIRLVVDVKGRPIISFTNNLSFKNRGVSKVRTGMNEDDQVRVVLDLFKDFQWKAYTMKPESGRGHRVVVDIFDYPGRLARAKKIIPTQARPITKAPIPVPVTGETVSNQQLTLESTGAVASLPQQQPKSVELSPVTSATSSAMTENSKFKPVIKEGTDVLGIKPVVMTEVPVSEVVSPTNAVLDSNTAGAQAIMTESTEVTAKTMPSTQTVAKDSAVQAPAPSIKPLGSNGTSTKAVASIAKPVVKNTSKPTASQSIFDDPSFKTTTVSKVEPLTATETKSKIPNTLPKKRKKGDIVVLIDPGHGGKDSGAIGKGGTYEKHIVLQIAKRLQRRLNETYGMRAILTRNTDRYITLRGRLKLVEKHKPDLFVSIHADAAQNRSASGSSVFILSNSGASSKTAKWIAQRENAVDSKYGNSVGDFSSDVSNVLLGMQQDITIESSHTLANKTLRQLKGIGKVHKRRVERAGFAVLKYPSIPSMLVETAFISNPEEERKLKKVSYQEELANAIAYGIEEFFEAQGDL